jgi:hypothetical protein
VRRPATLPAPLRRALASPGGRCYRHCAGPVRSVTLASDLPGLWIARACPAGVVSVTTYSERTSADPTPRVRAHLRRWAVPASVVRRSDLRLATRHGPELGRSAERRMAAARPPQAIRTVYWRLYPYRGKDGRERRLFLCARRTHAGPVFYVAPTDAEPSCPICLRAGRETTRARARGAGRR